MPTIESAAEHIPMDPDSRSLVGSNDTGGLKFQTSTLLEIEEALAYVMYYIDVREIVKLADQARVHIQETYLRWIFPALRLERMMYFLKGFSDRYHSGKYGPVFAIQKDKLKDEFKDWIYQNMMGLYPHEVFSLVDYVLPKLYNRSISKITPHRRNLLIFFEGVEKAVQDYKFVQECVKRLTEEEKHEKEMRGYMIQPEESNTELQTYTR